MTTDQTLTNYMDGVKLGKLQAAYEIRKVLIDWPAWINEEWFKEFEALANRLESEAGHPKAKD